MEGTNPPLLKGARLSGTLGDRPHYPGLRESSRGGRVETGNREREGLGRTEGVPPGDCGLGVVSLRGPSPSFQVGPPRT